MFQSSSNRRIFIARVMAGGSAIATFGAGAQATLDEKDPQAVALGYVTDTAKADPKKYPNHTREQRCANCQLYQGKTTNAAAPCTLFANKQVPAGAWCSAWAKKAA